MRSHAFNQVCFQTFSYPETQRPLLSTYKDLGGYKSWKSIVKDKLHPDEIIKNVKDSGLRGRGGAGFPTGLKWSFMPKGSNKQHYIVCNSDESEPGTCHDREILRYNPHAVIEGIAIAGYAIGATVGYNYIRGEFLGEPIHNFDKALQDAYEAGLLGKNIMGSGIDFDLFSFVGAGAYICGEETALLESLEGKQGKPRFKPPFPANYGLYGKPTTINNTQSLASVPSIVLNGPDWFKNLGYGDNDGTAIFSVSGHVNNPGNYELPIGIPFRDLLEIAGGVKDGKQLKAVIPGGSSVPALTASEIIDLNMDFDSLKKAGSAFGTGAVIIMDEDTCMVEVLKRISRFYFAESCGQCTPCREGTGWMYRLICKMLDGKASINDLDLLLDVANKIEGRTICAFGDASAWPVQSFLKRFRPEFEAKINHFKEVLPRGKLESCQI